MGIQTRPKLKTINELFLQFCMAYGTPEQEKARAIYERQVEREEAMAEGVISTLATESDHSLRSENGGMLDNLRTRTGPQSEAPTY